MLWLVNAVWAVALSPLVNQVDASPFPHAHHLEQRTDTRGAVASESDICSHIGIDLLRCGGNAADAVSTL
jgi:gamma-glutamyltranspeptidase